MSIVEVRFLAKYLEDHVEKCKECDEDHNCPVSILINQALGRAMSNIPLPKEVH
jgi:hypothetical protein